MAEKSILQKVLQVTSVVLVGIYTSFFMIILTLGALSLVTSWVIRLKNPVSLVVECCSAEIGSPEKDNSLDQDSSRKVSWWDIEVWRQKVRMSRLKRLVEGYKGEVKAEIPIFGSIEALLEFFTPLNISAIVLGFILISYLFFSLLFWNFQRALQVLGVGIFLSGGLLLIIFLTPGATGNLILAQGLYRLSSLVHCWVDAVFGLLILPGVLLVLIGVLLILSPRIYQRMQKLRVRNGGTKTV